MKIKSVILFLAVIFTALVVVLFANSCKAEDEHVHLFVDLRVVSDSTCAREGSALRTCTSCGTQELSPIAKKPHTEKVIPALAATCTDGGLTEGKICTVCGEIMVPQEEIRPSHSYFNGVCAACGAAASESDAQKVVYGAELEVPFYRPDGSELPGYTLVDLDIKRADLSVIYNSADGFYHYMRADGPVVLLKMDIATAYTAPLSALFADRSVRMYVYRDGENAVERISYAELLDKYIAASETESGGIGAYPLDVHLIRALRDLGCENGWWGVYANAQTQIFGADFNAIPTENAWMFALCYAELMPAEHKVTVRDSNGCAIIGAGIYACDDEGFVVARAVTDSDGAAILTFKHLSDFYVFFDSAHRGDYLIDVGGYRIDSDVLDIVLEAALESDGDGSGAYSPEDKYKEYNWKTAQIRVQISEQGTDGAFAPVYRRMLSGETLNTGGIDFLVSARNRTAGTTARVEVVYSYVQDTDDDYSFGTVGSGITEKVFALGSAAPDVFCDSVNDLTVASLKGCFYNMFAASADNRFSFIEYAYDGDTNSYGYNIELMSALSLSPTKSFILASDYLPDTVRALNVVPVSVSLLEKIAVGGELEFLGEDGFADVDRFHEAVKSGEWDYGLLAALCAAFSVGSSADGFVLDTSSERVAAALLYSADFKIFERAADTDAQTYSCVFEEENVGFYKFFGRLTELCSGFGISAEATDPADIRSRFSNSRLLFGGIVPLAALEGEEYKDAVDGGVYIAPIPKLDADDSYRTVLDGSARLAAINGSCATPQAVTAFLDYQSTHSTKICESYCLYNILYGSVGAEERNREALSLICSSFYPSYACVYDFAVEAYFSADADARWLSAALCGADFKINDARALWRTYSSRHSEYIKRLLKNYEAIK